MSHFDEERKGIFSVIIVGEYVQLYQFHKAFFSLF